MAFLIEPQNCGSGMSAQDSVNLVLQLRLSLFGLSPDGDSFRSYSRWQSVNFIITQSVDTGRDKLFAIGELSPKFT